MTNEEAIELLKNMHWSITTKMNGEVPILFALNMAIKALEQQNLCDGVKSHSEREILNACIQLLEEMVGHFRVYLDWADFKPDDEEKECGYFGMSYFHIVQKLFLQNTSHSGGTSTRQKCQELGIKDWSEGVRFKLWEGEADE